MPEEEFLLQICDLSPGFVQFAIHLVQLSPRFLVRQTLLEDLISTILQFNKRLDKKFNYMRTGVLVNNLFKIIILENEIQKNYLQNNTKRKLLRNASMGISVLTCHINLFESRSWSMSKKLIFQSRLDILNYKKLLNANHNSKRDYFCSPEQM